MACSPSSRFSIAGYSLSSPSLPSVSTSGSSCFMKSGVMSIESSSSVSSRSNVRPVNLVGMGPRGFSSFFWKGFFLSLGGAGGPKS